MKVRVVPYNPVWKLEFKREADSIAGILGTLLISVLCRGRIYSAVKSAFQSH